MTVQSRNFPGPPPPQVDKDPWRASFDAVAEQVRNKVWLILAAMVLGAMAGYAAIFVIPPSYKATAQLLIDPRGLRVFTNDLSAGVFDANASINFVESQMGVISSERVMLRVVRYPGLAELIMKGRTLRADDASVTATGDPVDPRQDLESSALAALKRAVSVTRAERSFLVQVTVKHRDPDAAATLANAILKAYREEDIIARHAATRNVVGDLGSRLEGLRDALRKAEKKVETYRVQNNLVGSREKFMLDQLSMLLDRRQATGATVAQLSATLGDRFPTLAGERNKLEVLNRQVAEKIAEIEKSRRAQVELRILEREVEGRRKILEAFETRFREASEFGQIDASNFRVISPARPPNGRKLGRNVVLWTVFGGIMGAFLAIFGFVALVLFRTGLAPQPAQHPIRETW